MKKILIALSLVAALSACGNKGKESNNSTVQQEVKIDDSKTAVIYFHSNHRCATCMTVEEVTKEAVAAYKEETPFYTVDITLDESKALMKKYNVVGQTLIIVKNDEKKDLTAEAFMYARSKPEKVKESIKSTLDALL